MDLSQWESYTARRRAKAWASIQVLWQGAGQRQGQGVAFQYCAINDAAVTAEMLVSWKAVRWYHRILHGPTCGAIMYLYKLAASRLVSTNELAASRLGIQMSAASRLYVILYSLSCVDCRHVVGGIPPLHYVVVFVLCSSLLLSFMISSMLCPGTVSQGQACRIRVSAWIWRSLVSTCPRISMMRI